MKKTMIWLTGKSVSRLVLTDNCDKITYIILLNIREEAKMKAVISVFGKDMVGILAKVSTTCAEANANVVEVTQSILDNYFVMIMLVDISKMNKTIEQLQEDLDKNVEGMKIHVMHEDIFNSMHRI